MKLVLDSKALLEKVQILNGAIVSNTTHEMLTRILFTRVGNALQMLSTDLNNSIKTTIVPQSMDDEEMNIAVEAKFLFEILKALPHQPITFSILNGQIEITSDSGHYSIPYLDGSEFPLPHAVTGKQFEVTAAQILKAYTISQFAMAVDELRPAFNGVLVESVNGRLNFVATDAHKLARLSIEKQLENFEIIVAKKTMTILKSFLSNNSSDVKVSWNNTNVCFECGDIVLIGRLIDAKFPNYEAVIPKGNPNRMQIDRTQLLSSVKRILLFSDTTTKTARLQMSDSGLKISAWEVSSSKHGEENLPCAYTGENMTIGFKANYLSEILNSLSSEEIAFETSKPERAGLILPTENTDSENVLMLIMPVKLTD